MAPGRVPDANLPGRAPHSARRRPESSVLARTWWLFALAFVIIAVAVVFFRNRPAAAEPLEGYLTDPGTLQQDYRRLNGKALQDPQAESLFRNATGLMLRRDYAGAVTALENI